MACIVPALPQARQALSAGGMPASNPSWIGSNREIQCALRCGQYGQPVQEQPHHAADGDDRQPAHEPLAGIAAAQHAPGARQQQPAQWTEQQQVVVGPAIAMRGAEPDEQHQRAEHARQQPERQRDRRERARPATAEPDRADADRRCRPAPTATSAAGPSCGSGGSRCGSTGWSPRTSGRPWPLVVSRRASARRIGTKDSFPQRLRQVGGRAQAQVEAQPHPRRRTTPVAPLRCGRCCRASVLRSGGAGRPPSVRSMASRTRVEQLSSKYS